MRLHSAKFESRNSTLFLLQYCQRRFAGQIRIKNLLYSVADMPYEFPNTTKIFLVGRGTADYHKKLFTVVEKR